VRSEDALPSFSDFSHERFYKVHRTLSHPGIAPNATSPVPQDESVSCNTPPIRLHVICKFFHPYAKKLTYFQVVFVRSHVQLARKQD
jgi:hypothetical protein